jgi:hypothetical protein
VTTLALARARTRARRRRPRLPKPPPNWRRLAVYIAICVGFMAINVLRFASGDGSVVESLAGACMWVLWLRFHLAEWRAGGALPRDEHVRMGMPAFAAWLVCLALLVASIFGAQTP